MYTNIKSQYIKNKVKGLPWSRHNYIDALIAIERFILKPPHTLMGNLYLSSLKLKYSQEFSKILSELKPKDHQKYLNQLKEESKERVKQRKLVQAEENKLKVEWQKAGGKI